MGVETDSSDAFSITFAVEKVRSTIKNEINWQDVPEGLEHIAVDMAVGEFLLSKKTFAPESSLTTEQRLDNFINYPRSYGKSEFASFRRIKW